MLSGDDRYKKLMRTCNNYRVSLLESEQKNRELKEQLHELTKQLHESTEQLQEMETKYEAVINSSSWKLTTPLRSVLDKVRKPKKDTDNRPKAAAVSESASVSEDQISVSVIIPVYNGIKHVSKLFDSLKAQEHIDDLEIIAVDSGSNDGTIEVCQEAGIKLIKIPHKSFTHSYARNLGAENAKGNILLFMTQDALPIGNDWIYRMTEPIKNGEADACSAREKNPGETELFYRIATYNYACFLGTVDLDKLNRLDGSESFDEVRKKASITDISAAIKAEVFNKYKYRFDYAEDLDLGIRILNDGGTIKLFKDVRVEHGHNRDMDYYFKRCYVETEAFKKIFPDHETEELPIHTVFLRTVSLLDTAKLICNHSPSIEVNNINDARQYIDEIIDYAEECAGENAFFLNAINIDTLPVLLEKTVDIARDECADEVYGDYKLAYELINYLKYEVKPYFEGCQTIEEAIPTGNTVDSQLKDSIMKQSAALIGSELGHIAKNDKEKIKDLAIGSGI